MHSSCLIERRTRLVGRVTFRLLIPFIVLTASAQNSFTIRPTVTPDRFRGISMHREEQPARPKVGLVLSGGGGRGLAQIGVLRALERRGIPIDFIVGNSLGSVIGGLYSAGYSTTAIESIATHTNWSELLSFSGDTKRTDLFVGQKQSEEEGFLLIRFDGLAPIIPSAISTGQRFSNFFSYLTLQAVYHPNPGFDDLKVRFRATATDLLSGRRVVLDHGSLAEAMRASVTVPLLYSPLERDSMFLVDGGLKSNIPVDVARSAGCDVVIAVNSTSSMRGAAQLNAPWEIADQIMTIMMQEPNERQLGLADVVITPATRERVVSDFSGVDTLIAAGELAGERAIGPILDALKKRIQQSCAKQPGRNAPGFFVAGPWRSAPRARMQPAAAAEKRLLFRIVFCNCSVCRPRSPSLAGPAACFLPARRDESAETAKRPSRGSERESHDQNLGAKHLGQRAEGDVGGRRARAAARAHRRRRRLRQDQGSAVPGDEPECAGADA